MSSTYQADPPGELVVPRCAVNMQNPAGVIAAVPPQKTQGQAYQAELHRMQHALYQQQQQQRLQQQQVLLGQQQQETESFQQQQAALYRQHHARQQALLRQQKARQKAAAEAAAKAEEELGDDLGDGLEEGNTFAKVDTKEWENGGLRPHPDPIAETSSLSSVQLPKSTYVVGLPKNTLTKGISALQFQTVQMACAAFENFLPDKSRYGFYLGDGPGVGKGRQIAAVILENFCRGRQKAVWFSASGDLAEDAKRDFRDIGALEFDAVRIHNLKKLKVKQGDSLTGLPGLDKGIVFATYDLLISTSRAVKTPSGHRAPATDDSEVFGVGSRLRQIVDWCGGPDFHGCIVFDECHRAKNSMAREHVSDSGHIHHHAESKTSRAVVELQRQLPNARILYVSATGATNPENLGYMQRLGLWGAHTAFPTKIEFVNMLKNRGVGAMELVAMELKQQGLLLARTLSYEGVTFDQVHVDVSPAFRDLYDSACDLWADVDIAFQGANEDGLYEKSSLYKSARTKFYGAQLRFFRQLCTAAKVDEVEQLAKQALQDGHCVVIGLQSTGEARTTAMVEECGGEAAIFDSFVEPAALILSSLIKSCLPPESRERAGLIRRAESMKLPPNPLDDLIDRLGGVDKVAEMTGRKKRMVRMQDGSFRYLARADAVPMDMVNIEEKNAFQDGTKLVAIISDAASTGISLQSDKRAGNTRVRVHMTLELAWSADKTVQQLGRTHRSNQKHPPKYLILSTDICGEHRFASAVAKRLEQLGALTHGDRHAASAAEVLSGFNIQNKYSVKALRLMSQELMRPEPLSAVTPHFMSEKLGDLEAGSAQYIAARSALFKVFIREARTALHSVGVIDLSSESGEELGRLNVKNMDGNKGLSIDKFLNRLLAIRINLQAQIFQYFTVLQAHEVQQAKRFGLYDECGITKPSFGDIKLKKREAIYQSNDTGIPTFHYEYETDRGVSWETALVRLQQDRERDPDTASGFFHSVNSANGVDLPVLALERDARGRVIKSHKKRKKLLEQSFFRIVRPGSGFSDVDMSWKDLHGKGYRPMADARMRKIWERVFRTGERLRKQPLHLITGAILPILPDLHKAYVRYGSARTTTLKVYRVETTDKTSQHIGVYVPNTIIYNVLAAVRNLQPVNPFCDGKLAETISQPEPHVATAPPWAQATVVAKRKPQEAKEAMSDDEAGRQDATQRRKPKDRRQRRVYARRSKDDTPSKQDAKDEADVEKNAALLAASGLWDPQAELLLERVVPLNKCSPSPATPPMMLELTGEGEPAIKPKAKLPAETFLSGEESDADDEEEPSTEPTPINRPSAEHLTAACADGGGTRRNTTRKASRGVKEVLAWLREDSAETSDESENSGNTSQASDQPKKSGKTKSAPAATKTVSPTTDTDSSTDSEGEPNASTAAAAEGGATDLKSAEAEAADRKSMACAASDSGSKGDDEDGAGGSEGAGATDCKPRVVPCMGWGRYHGHNPVRSQTFSFSSPIKSDSESSVDGEDEPAVKGKAGKGVLGESASPAAKSQPEASSSDDAGTGSGEGSDSGADPIATQTARKAVAAVAKKGAPTRKPAAAGKARAPASENDISDASSGSDSANEEPAAEIDATPAAGATSDSEQGTGANANTVPSGHPLLRHKNKRPVRRRAAANENTAVAAVWGNDEAGSDDDEALDVAAARQATPTSSARKGSVAKRRVLLDSDESHGSGSEAAKSGYSDDDCPIAALAMAKQKQSSKSAVLQSNSQVSEGWKVKCCCGAEEDDGDEMLECNACGVWQHTACNGITDITTYFTCSFCRSCAQSKPTEANKTLKSEASKGITAVPEGDKHQQLSMAANVAVAAAILAQAAAQKKRKLQLREDETTPTPTKAKLSSPAQALLSSEGSPNPRKRHPQDASPAPGSDKRIKFSSIPEPVAAPATAVAPAAAAAADMPEAALAPEANTSDPAGEAPEAEPSADARSHDPAAEAVMTESAAAPESVAIGLGSADSAQPANCTPAAAPVKPKVHVSAYQHSFPKSKPKVDFNRSMAALSKTTMMPAAGKAGEPADPATQLRAAVAAAALAADQRAHAAEYHNLRTHLEQSRLAAPESPPAAVAAGAAAEVEALRAEAAAALAQQQQAHERELSALKDGAAPQAQAVAAQVEEQVKARLKQASAAAIRKALELGKQKGAQEAAEAAEAKLKQAMHETEIRSLRSLVTERQRIQREMADTKAELQQARADAEAKLRQAELEKAAWKQEQHVWRQEQQALGAWRQERAQLLAELARLKGAAGQATAPTPSNLTASRPTQAAQATALSTAMGTDPVTPTTFGSPITAALPSRSAAAEGRFGGALPTPIAMQPLPSTAKPPPSSHADATMADQPAEQRNNSSCMADAALIWGPAGGKDVQAMEVERMTDVEPSTEGLLKWLCERESKPASRDEVAAGYGGGLHARPIIMQLLTQLEEDLDIYQKGGMYLLI